MDNSFAFDEVIVSFIQLNKYFRRVTLNDQVKKIRKIFLQILFKLKILRIFAL